MKIRRPSGAFLAAIIVHLVIVVIFAQAVMFRNPLFDLFGRKEAPIPPPERIGFLVYPSGPISSAPSAPAQRPGPPSVSPAPPTVVAPTVVPTEVAPAPSKPEKPQQPDGPTTGPLVGGQGNMRGVQPRYEDPRLWTHPGAIATAPTMPKTDAEKLDSVITEALQPYKDSMQVAAAAKGRAPGDWTVGKDGQKYGIDQKFIRLGPVSIPTALLALLPLNVTGNPVAIERERRNSAMREEIGRQAQQRINEADFQKAVKSIRERKERERKEQEKEQAAKKAADKSAAPNNQ